MSPQPADGFQIQKIRNRPAMLVKCVCNSVRHVQAAPALHAEIENTYRLPGDTVHLTVGKSYVVYAIVFRRHQPCYFIADDDFPHLDYPLAYHSPFFELLDNHLSKRWVFGYAGIRSQEEPVGDRDVLIAFPEWVNDGAFFEELVNGRPENVALFKKHKAAMDLEFPDPSVALAATICEGLWLLCPRCNDAWETPSQDGLVKCPSCSTVLLNPRFVDRQVAP